MNQENGYRSPDDENLNFPIFDNRIQEQMDVERDNLLRRLIEIEEQQALREWIRQEEERIQRERAERRREEERRGLERLRLEAEQVDRFLREQARRHQAAQNRNAQVAVPPVRLPDFRLRRNVELQHLRGRFLVSRQRHQFEQMQAHHQNGLIHAVVEQEAQGQQLQVPAQERLIPAPAQQIENVPRNIVADQEMLNRRDDLGPPFPFVGIEVEPILQPRQQRRRERILINANNRVGINDQRMIENERDDMRNI